MTTANCPECQADITIAGDARLNEILVCDDCSSELELIMTSPMTLALAPEVEEDWGE